MSTWIAVLAVGAGSYLFRAVPLFSTWFAAPPAAVERVLQHAGTASLSALAVLAVRHQTVGAGAANTAATAAAMATGAAVAWRRAPMYAVVAAGLGVHLLVRAALG